MSSKSIGEVAYTKPLRLCGMEELAARQHVIQPSGGILFARATAHERKQKDTARQRILNLFDPVAWPGNLRMLTMPGIHWRFERLLLGARENGWLQHQRTNPKRTYFTCAENDRAIYYAAIAQMPGLHANQPLQRIKHHQFAEMGYKTHYAALFFANIDDMMMITDWNTGWDAVWLDYTGPISLRRLKIIERFYYSSAVHHILIITALRARWDRDTTIAIEKAGGHSRWLRKHLDGEVLHDLEYQDSVPMSQFAIRKDRWKSPLC
jgi:hypothetical protein